MTQASIPKPLIAELSWDYLPPLHKLQLHDTYNTKFKSIIFTVANVQCNMTANLSVTLHEK